VCAVTQKIIHTPNLWIHKIWRKSATKTNTLAYLSGATKKKVHNRLLETTNTLAYSPEPWGGENIFQNTSRGCLERFWRDKRSSLFIQIVREWTEKVLWHRQSSLSIEQRGYWKLVVTRCLTLQKLQKWPRHQLENSLLLQIYPPCNKLGRLSLGSFTSLVFWVVAQW